MEKKTPITKLRHPLYTRLAPEWTRWRLAYEGGQEFIDAYLEKYSKREPKQDFDQRKKLAYNPAHTTRVVNTVRNSLTAKFSDIKRVGDPRYVKAVTTDVDLQNDTMNAFIGLRVVPMLLVQARRLVVIDAPPIEPGTTRLEDSGAPYMWAVGAEDCLSWHLDEESGHLDRVLIREYVDVEDEDTGLVAAVRTQYRFMRYIEAGEEFGDYKGPGALVTIYDGDNKVLDESFIAGLTRLPVVDMQLVQSLVQDIAAYQIALLNLASTDMSFLFRGNFPMYTQQYFPGRGSIKPRETKQPTSPTSTVTRQDRESDEDLSGGQRHGASTGVAYSKDLERPGFIAPPTDNVRISMEKQKDLREEINILVDISLTSMAVKALEQSGKSKEMDRAGKEEGLMYVGQVLETGEREIAEIYHEFLGSNQKYDVRYPTDYRVRSQEDRNNEVAQLGTIKELVRSETYQKTVDKRIAQVAIQPFTDAATLQKIENEIDESEWFDESEKRSTIIAADVTAQVLSPETATGLRGYDSSEATKAAAAAARVGDMLSGGPVVPPTDNNNAPAGPQTQVDATPDGGNDLGQANAEPTTTQVTE